jgi:hypothetical protein
MREDKHHGMTQNVNKKPIPYLWTIWDRTDSLTAMQLLILVVLDSFHGKRGIFPSQTRVAKRARLSRMTVNKGIKALRKFGFVTSSGRGKALRYQLSVPGQASPATCMQRTQQVRTSTAGAAHQVDRDLKYPNELTKRTWRQEKPTNERPRGATAAASRLAMSLPSEQRPSQRHRQSIRDLAIQAGLSMHEATRAEIGLAEELVNRAESDAVTLKAEVVARLAEARTPDAAWAAFTIGRRRGEPPSTPAGERPLEAENDGRLSDPKDGEAAVG